MSRVILALSGLVLFSACKSDEEKADELYNDYLDAICRLYSDPTCVSNMEDTCPVAISFDSAADCVSFFILFSDPACDLGAVMLENQDAAEACIDSIESFDCASEDMCDAEGGMAPEAGDCADVSAALAQACPTGTDTGT